MKIQILMSTYNGQQYLRQQLDSFFSQSILQKPEWEWEITVRDDGSSDDTVMILREYAGKHPEMHIVQGENKGVIDSFLDLIMSASEDADYIALSDQDDVWMEDKLEQAVRSLQAKGKDTPLLYCGMPQLVNEDMQIIPSIMYTDNMRPSFGNAVAENICTGCTAVFNQALARILRKEKPTFTVMHDWWLYLVASCYGEVIFDEIPHMYYRQHTDNAVGVQKNYWREFLARCSRFAGNRYNISHQVQALCDFCQHMEEHGLSVEEEKMKLMQDMISARNNFTKRITLMKNPMLYRQRKGDNMIFRVILLLGTM